MQKKIFILLVTFLFLNKAEYVFSNNLQQQLPATTDTTIENEKTEEEIIDEVIKTKTAPSKDRVQYFSQVTKYGFKNLFNKYSYNTSLSYSSQVNPSASEFIQDYMKAHGSYLTKMKGWGQPYFTLIESILTQYGLPREL